MRQVNCDHCGVGLYWQPPQDSKERALVQRLFSAHVKASAYCRHRQQILENVFYKMLSVPDEALLPNIQLPCDLCQINVPHSHGKAEL